ncbi:MAG: aspartate--ammonia ligase [Bacilli bacterium]
MTQKYKTLLDLQDTEKAIKLVKDTFQVKLANKLNLLRVSAPLFVQPETGLNDNLNGFEKPVSFELYNYKTNLEIVQSLAKWKRHALKKYNIATGSGIYTDMNAIRPFEELDNMHSCYVDQWDWERAILKENRNEEFLKDIVRKIYAALKETAAVVSETYSVINYTLPKEISFVTTSELEEKYPTLSRKERENAIAKEKKALFLMQIGGKLKDGKPHDGRADDYDDWKLNGDIIFWYEPLEIAFEISSMGIRVDEESLVSQVIEKHEEWKLEMPFHKDILSKSLPYSIGGGIGQSRLCMFMLKKAHIGEVQSSYWDSKTVKECEEQNISLL